MDLRIANLLPQRASMPDHASGLVAQSGAALISGLATVDEAVDFARHMLGDRAIRVTPQFEATKATMDANESIVAAQPVDERGRKRVLGSPDRSQPAHNDGYAFGDFAPDYVFLYCARPCPFGGASFLVDALKVVNLLSADDAEFARFVWNEHIDHSEPNFPQGTTSPIARITSGGRVQVRSNPYQLPVLGPDESAHLPFVQKWGRSVAEARTKGPHFRLEAGEMICVDNYRILHGRDAYVDPERKVVSIWGWSTSAVAVPDIALSIAEPVIPRLAAVG